MTGPKPTKSKVKENTVKRIRKALQYKLNEKALQKLKGLQNGFVFDIRSQIEWIDSQKGTEFNSKHYRPLVDGNVPYMKRGTNAYDSFWDEQDRRCIEGYAPIVDGVQYPRITGPHYFYLNMFMIMMKKVNERRKRLSNPYYRALDHQIFLELEKAERDGYGIIVGKARRMGLSYIGGVMILWNMLFFKDNPVAIGAGKEDKAKLLFDKIIKSLENLRDEYRVKYTKKTSNPIELTLGYRMKEHGVDKLGGILSKLDVKTFFSDVSAFEGGSYSFFIFEEIGIHHNLIESYKATEPSFTDGADQFGVPFLFGCVCAGTKVWNNKGELKNIEDLQQKEGILGYNGNGVEKEKIVWMKPPDKKLCYRIETTGGNYIECSDDHPLMWSKLSYRGSYNKKKVTFQLAKDIKVGDQLMVLNKVSVFGKEKIKDARLIGLLIGDGNYSKNATAQLSVGNIEIGNYVKTKYKTKTYKSHIKKEGGIYESIGILNFKNTLQKHGIYGQVKTHKRLPKYIYDFNKKSITELLGGYYDADGNVNYNKKKNVIRVVLSSISKELLIEVKYQLLKLGIGSSLVKENRNIKPSKGYEGQLDYIYRLYVSRRDDVIRFQKEIKFLCKDKQNTLNKVLTLKNNGNNIKLSSCKFELNPKNDKGHFFIGKNNLKGLRSERVTKIECIGKQNIYNMHTGHSNTYLSNGFVTKQTGGEVDKGSRDFKIMMASPESYNLKKIFLPKYMYYPGRDKDEDDSKEMSELDKMDANVNFFDVRTGLTDEDGALKHILKRRLMARKSKAGYIKECQSNPIKESDIFLKTSGGLLNRIALSGQRERIYNNEQKNNFIQGRYEWVDQDSIRTLLARCRNTKEKNLIRIRYKTPVEFIPDIDGKAFKLDGFKPINNRSAPWLSDIQGTDSYDEEAVVESGSLGASMIYRCFSGLSQDFDLPISYLLERGDGSSEDTFFDNNLKMSVYWRSENLIEYTKIALLGYYKDCGADMYLRINPNLRDEVVTNKGKQQYGVRMTAGATGFKALVTKLLKMEVQENVDNIDSETIIDDLIEYGDSNTDLAMAYGVVLIHKLDIFDHIVDDLDDNTLSQGDVLMDWAYVSHDEQGNVIYKTYAEDSQGDSFKIEQWDPRRDLTGEDRESFINFEAVQSKERKKQRERAEQAYLEKVEYSDPFKRQIKEFIENN